MVILQVDDSLGFGTDQFLDKEMKVTDEFECKERTILTPGSKERFNGCHLHLEHNYDILMEASEKLEKLSNPRTAKEFESTRAKIQYAASLCRPDLVGCSQMLKSVSSSPSKTDFKLMNKLVKHLSLIHI